jgi:hypothetical protein
MMRHRWDAYKRHPPVPEAQGAVMSEYEHTCLIRGDGGQTLRAILDRICNKWTLLIVATLDQGRLGHRARPAHRGQSNGLPSPLGGVCDQAARGADPARGR